MDMEKFSYAAPDDPLLRRLIIRAIESFIGQPFLKELYSNYRSSGVPHHLFFAKAIELLDIDVQWHGSSFDNIPPQGPLVFVANHPYGVLDGLIICLLANQTRRDFKILINSVLCNAPEMESCSLPIDFGDTTEAIQTNVASRKAAREHLQNGGALIVFPAGGVATTPTIFSRQAQENDWAPLVGQLIRRSRASVVPIYFSGQNSLFFQVASHFNYTLRTALLFRETQRRMGTVLDVVLGDPLIYEQLEDQLPPVNLAKMLQRHTQALAKQYDFAG